MVLNYGLINGFIVWNIWYVEVKTSKASLTDIAGIIILVKHRRSSIVSACLTCDDQISFT